MPCIIPIVEGHGEINAVPLLVRRILYQQQWWHWSVSRPIQAGSLYKLKKKLAEFIAHAQKKKDCGGILILLDLDDGCPADEAANLAEQVRRLYLRCPVAIVFAHPNMRHGFWPVYNIIRIHCFFNKTNISFFESYEISVGPFFDF